MAIGQRIAARIGMHDGVCDGAQCTLREAITSANSATGTDTIDFNIPAVPDPNCVDGTGVCTITPASVLPNVSQPIVIDGYTQTGASANTNPINMGSNAVLKIELNGTSAGAGQTGLIINGGSSITGPAWRSIRPAVFASSMTGRCGALNPTSVAVVIKAVSSISAAVGMDWE